MLLIAATCGAIAGLRLPVHWTPLPVPMTEPGAPTFLYRRTPSSGCVPWAMLSAAFAATDPRFCSVALQCVTPPAANDVGAHVFDSVTLPCFFTKATGM